MRFSNIITASTRAFALIAMLATLGLFTGCGSGTETSADSAADDTDSSSASVAKVSDTDTDVNVAPAPNVSVTSDVSVSSDVSVDVEPDFPETLGIGDKAPAIHLAKFYNGDAIEKLEDGRIHVIEFWATWCPPCRTSMPHLSELQELYEDKVTIIGITDEGQGKVGPFLGEKAPGQNGKIWAEVVKYRLAQDKLGWTSSSYMKPAGQNGIPSAFIVGADGYVEWIGHPMQMDDPLAKIVDGTWDRESGAKMIGVKQELTRALRSGDVEGALAAVQKMEDLDPDDSTIATVRFQIFAGEKQFDDAQQTAADALQGDADENALNMMAWSIATDFPNESRDLELALQLAQKANELTDENASPVIDTLARVHYERGEVEDAVKWQEKAVLYGDNPSYQQSLDRYKDEKDKPEIPDSLTIGDPAPGIYAEQWFTGEAIEDFESGKVYVVEFWATWCPPCRTSMPHLSSLQDEYGDDVVFIGVTTEAEDVVAPFLKEKAEGQNGKTWEEVVTYRLAKDRHEWTSQSYMTAAKQKGIPSAFVVGKEGVIEWIGHPMQMDKALKQIVAGEWDRAAAIEKAAVKERVQEALAAVAEPMAKAQQSGEWDEVVDLLSDVEKELGDDAGEIAGMKISVLLQAKKYEQAMALAKEFADGDSEDSRMLTMVSWEIATAVPEEQRDLDVALKIAQRANTVTDEQSPAVIDTLARVYFEMGDFDKAIEWQSTAVELGGNAFEKALGDYKDAKNEAENPAEEEPLEDDDIDSEEEGAAA